MMREALCFDDKKPQLNWLELHICLSMRMSHCVAADAAAAPKVVLQGSWNLILAIRQWTMHIQRQHAFAISSAMSNKPFDLRQQGV